MLYLIILCFEIFYNKYIMNSYILIVLVLIIIYFISQYLKIIEGKSINSNCIKNGNKLLDNIINITKLSDNYVDKSDIKESWKAMSIYANKKGVKTFKKINKNKKLIQWFKKSDRPTVKNIYKNMNKELKYLVNKCNINTKKKFMDSLNNYETINYKKLN